MQPLRWETYSDSQLQLLAWEAKVTLKGVKMTGWDTFYTIEFPGLYHKYRSLARANSVLVYPAGQRREKYKAWVQEVEDDCVRLKFSRRLFVQSLVVDVQFTDNSWNMTNQRRAVESAVAKDGLRHVLFPELHSKSAQPIVLPHLRLFNQQLANDHDQYQAVQHIVAGTSKPAAYVLFGPPGTGKTVTLVEAIMQIEAGEADSHILACASHNNSADLICQQIVKEEPTSNVLRMYCRSMDTRRIPRDLKDRCNLNGEEFFFTKPKLMQYKVVVCTLFTAARLVHIPKGHFTHIFIDNAERALETECLIPIAGLLDGGSGQLVVTGDPKQFGPIVKSPVASRRGMGVSLLERWMSDSLPYQKTDDEYNKRYVTKLRHNYRSHPAILKAAGDDFSSTALTACADMSLPSTQLSYSCAQWGGLPAQGFPVIFHAVNGVTEREESSFYNKAEVEKLMYYVKKLLQTKDNSFQPAIKPSDIGIIARYRKQVQEISEALKKVGKGFKINGLNKLKVGTVERFQDEARRVILLSTICSSQTPLHAENFVKDEKAFYVAVTRAKALLIVVGDPKVWRQGDTWNFFIMYCEDNGGYIN